MPLDGSARKQIHAEAKFQKFVTGKAKRGTFQYCLEFFLQFSKKHHNNSKLPVLYIYINTFRLQLYLQTETLSFPAFPFPPNLYPGNIILLTVFSTGLEYNLIDNNNQEKEVVEAGALLSALRLLAPQGGQPGSCLDSASFWEWWEETQRAGSGQAAHAWGLEEKMGAQLKGWASLFPGSLRGLVSSDWTLN